MRATLDLYCEKVGIPTFAELNGGHSQGGDHDLLFPRIRSLDFGKCGHLAVARTAGDRLIIFDTITLEQLNNIGQPLQPSGAPAALPQIRIGS